MDLTMVAFGFAVGLLVGITGTGGGSVMTPLREPPRRSPSVRASGSSSG